MSKISTYEKAMRLVDGLTEDKAKLTAENEELRAANTHLASENAAQAAKMAAWLAQEETLTAELAELHDRLDGVPCTWTEDDEGVWSTSCGELWQFTDGDPADNGAVWCMHCGKRIAAVKYQESEEE